MALSPTNGSTETTVRFGTHKWAATATVVMTLFPTKDPISSQNRGGEGRTSNTDLTKLARRLL
jgi:hypothetical protein